MENSVKARRNYGIDLLKMFSMFLVVILHVLGQGGILYNTELLSVNYNVAWSMELIAFCAVNCFALASGYVGINGNYKFSRIIYLWSVTVFYGILSNIIFSFCGMDLSLQMWKAAFMPFLYGNMRGFYWFFTAYAVTFLFIPFFNHLINTLTKKQATLLVAALLFVFSAVPTIKGNDYFKTTNGYSYAWISTLYIIGAYLKKYEIGKNTKTKRIAIYTAVSMLVTCLGHIILDYISVNFLSKDISGEVDMVSNSFAIDSNYLSGSMFANYTFPTIVLNAVLLLLLFSRIDIRNTKAQEKIKEFSALNFSVYLIHTNKLVFENIISGLFESVGKLNPIIMILAVIGLAMLIYVICIMIDMLRYELFKLFKINSLCELTVQKFSLFVRKIYEKNENGEKVH